MVVFIFYMYISLFQTWPEIWSFMWLRLSAFMWQRKTSSLCGLWLCQRASQCKYQSLTYYDSKYYPIVIRCATFTIFIWVPDSMCTCVTNCLCAYICICIVISIYHIIHMHILCAQYWFLYYFHNTCSVYMCVCVCVDQRTISYSVKNQKLWFYSVWYDVTYCGYSSLTEVCKPHPIFCSHNSLSLNTK